MTTATIESLATALVSGVAAPDLPLNVLLRKEVIPKFLIDIGSNVIRRATAVLTVVVGTQAYDLADDFGSMVEVAFEDNLGEPLRYIGEDTLEVLAAEATTSATPDTPTGYYLTRRTTTAILKKLKLNCFPLVDDTIRYIYWSNVQFADDTTSVELNQYIPEQFQWALVEALKAKIYEARFGIGDSRYVAANQAYQEWVGRADSVRELARRNQPIFMN